jgi:hypothetical protein
LYQQLLRRQAEASAVSTNAAALQGGMRVEALIASIVATPEYAALV